MQRCLRVGIDVTKRCNWKCQTCFYRWKADFNSKWDLPLDDLGAQISVARDRGCDHALLVGFGEPSLYPSLNQFIDRCAARNMTSSIITNGSMDPARAIELYRRGLNHLHISVHGLGAVLDAVAGSPGAGDRQARVIDVLAAAWLPWRSNTTMQKTNYQQIPDIVRFCIDRGVRHFVFLGFLPHYEWNTRLGEVAVHPEELRPYIEQGLGIIEAHNASGGNVLATVRYHPMCHLRPDYWKYVVNARYVLYDPWEWDNYYTGGDAELWKAAIELGDTVAIQGPPCAKCSLRMHCGGWNRIYAAGFDGAGLHTVRDDVPQTPGYYHDQNPANAAKGWF